MLQAVHTIAKPGEPTGVPDFVEQNNYLPHPILMSQKTDSSVQGAATTEPTVSPKTSILHVSAAGVAPGRPMGPYEITTLISVEAEAATTAYRVRIEPHQSTATSYHLIAEELYFVIEGRGLAILNGVEYPLEAGDFLRLPPGVRHAFRTGGDPLVMLDIHTPGSRPDRDVYFDGEPPPGFGQS